jgi:flagellar hook-associated protein FlgK
MSDLVGISSGAVQAYQRALSVVSNNIANVGTEGYTRQVSDLAATAPKRVGQAYMGTGVDFQAVRRAVDDFVQQNMRNSNSDLANQKPLVDYANRVVDIMGSEDSGLTTAIDEFFAAARELSADPSSSILRGAFLRQAEGLTSRFNEIDTQLEAIRSETLQYMGAATGELNALAKELVALNKQLAKSSTLENQSPVLLDQRDLLLQKMSTYASLTTAFSQNGEVSVSLAGTMTKGLIVDGRNAVELAVTANAQDPSRYDALLDPYGDKEPVSGLSSGELGGLLAFSEQVLGPAKDRIDYLAEVLVREVNAIHTDGLDGYGNKGGPLFTFEPDAAPGAASIVVALDDPRKIVTAALFRAMEAPSNPSDVRVDWAFEEPEHSASEPPLLSMLFADTQAPPLSVSVELGRNLSTVATIAQGTADAVVYLDEAQPGQQLQVMTRDGVHLLGAELSLDQRVELMSAYPPVLDSGAVYSTAYLNKTGIDSYKRQDLFLGAKGSQEVVEQYTPEGNRLPDKVLEAALMGHPISASQVGTVIEDGQVTFNHVTLGALNVEPNQELQASDVAEWLSTATVRPLGSSEATLTINQALINLNQGLRVTGDRGQFADIVQPDGGFADLAAVGDAINVYEGLTKVRASIVNGDLQLTGINGFAAEIEAVANVSGVPGVTVSARTDVVVEASKVKLNKSLSIGGRGKVVVDIVPPVGRDWSSITELAHAIQSESGRTGVTAYINAEGNMVITNAPGNPAQGEDLALHEGKDIYISAPAGQAENALSLDAGWFKGHIEMVRADGTQIEGIEESADIRIGMGKSSGPWLLQKLGLRVGAYLGPAAPADIRVLLTGVGTAKVAADFNEIEVTAADTIRSEPFEVRFTALDRYDIVDSNTGTVMATREFDPHALPPNVTFMGMRLEFTSPPMLGDRFLIDGNNDGVGDNRAVLALVELQDRPVMPGEMTLTDAYINQVSQVGNISRQAKVAQGALTVVYEQAVQANAQVSGVSLDEEAADLIRFQQAYQASAKVMQTASSLFDAILQVR